MPATPLSRRAILACCAATGPWAGARAAAPLSVVASFSILADLAKVIGGDAVTVTSLVGPNQDGHTYQPRPSDIRTVTQAQIMIVNGLGFEGWMDRLRLAANFRGQKITATTAIQARPGDPHAWQDIANTKIYVANIRDGLALADPANAIAYSGATAAYLTQLDRLETEIRAAWAPIPRPNRRIVTSHDAFTYYGAAYGVDFLAPQGIAADSEPSPRQLAILIAQIRAQKIRALFVETISNPQIQWQIARETGAIIGQAVYSDALSDAAGPAGSYLAMMRHNTGSFISALR